MARPKNFSTMYLDSGPLIRYFTKDTGWRTVERLIQAAEAGQLTLQISPMIVVETLGQGFGKRGWNPEQEAVAQTILDSPAFQQVNFTRFVALKARDLRLEHRLKTCDAIHLAGAICFGAEVFFTTDCDDFAIGSPIEGVWVDEPYFPGEPTLFEDS